MKQGSAVGKEWGGGFSGKIKLAPLPRKWSGRKDRESSISVRGPTPKGDNAPRVFSLSVAAVKGGATVASKQAGNTREERGKRDQVKGEHFVTVKGSQTYPSLIILKARPWRSSNHENMPRIQFHVVGVLGYSQNKNEKLIERERETAVASN